MLRLGNLRQKLIAHLVGEFSKDFGIVVFHSLHAGGDRPNDRPSQGDYYGGENKSHVGALSPWVELGLLLLGVWRMGRRRQRLKEGLSYSYILEMSPREKSFHSGVTNNRAIFTHLVTVSTASSHLA